MSTPYLLVHSPISYLAFVVFNFVLIALLQFFVASRGEVIELGFFVRMLLPSLVIIVIQYPLLNASRTWKSKWAVFYLSMLLFLFLLGLAITWDQPVGANAAGSFAAIADGTLRIVIFGHSIGVLFLPLVVFSNIALRKFFFFQFSTQLKN